MHEGIPPRHIDPIGEEDRYGLQGFCGFECVFGSPDAIDRGPLPRREYQDLVAQRYAPREQAAGIAPVIGRNSGENSARASACQRSRTIPGFITYCTANRKGASARVLSSGTASSHSSTVGPSYHAMLPERTERLSPRRAETGMTVHAGSAPRRLASFAIAPQCSRSSSYRSRDQATASILLTAKQIFPMPHSVQMRPCRRVCSSTPSRASTRITAALQLEAAVAIFRVYSSCPGLSATMNFRLWESKYR